MEPITFSIGLVVLAIGGFLHLLQRQQEEETARPRIGNTGSAANEPTPGVSRSADPTPGTPAPEYVPPS
jgi:hypothetical protein